MRSRADRSQPVSEAVHREPIRLTTQLVQVRVRESQRIYLESPACQPLHIQEPSQAVEARRPIAVERVINEPATSQRLAELLSEIRDAIQRFDERRDLLLQEMQEVAIELSIAAASHLVYSSIESHQFGIDKFISDIIETIGSKLTLTISLNPLDHKLLSEQLVQKPDLQDYRNLQFETVPNLVRGSCRVSSSCGESWTTDISTRLNELRKHWLEDLDASQIERRKAQGTASGVRRFPDRRDTA